MIQVYEVGYQNYASMGLGSITPASCIVHEEQSAAYELELTCVMDERLTYDLLMPGRVLRVPVPAATTPMYKIQATTQKEYWRGGGTVYSNKSTNTGHMETVTKTREYRVTVNVKPKITVYRTLSHPVVIKTPQKPQYKLKTDTWTEEVWVPGDSSMVAELMPDTQVIVINKSDPSWLQISTPQGQTGWIQRGNMTYAYTVPGQPAETVQSKKIRDQLFRIYRVEKDTNALEVKAWARHITYDLMGNVVMGGIHKSVTLSAIIDQIMYECSQQGHGFNIYTDQPGMVLTDVDVRHKNIIEALLDPEDGIVAKSNLRMVRDNFDIYLTNANQEQRAPLTYGRNLMGVTLDVNEDAAVNRIIPVGTNKNGDPVLIDAKWINSPRNTEETIIRAKVIEYNEARERDAREATEHQPAEPGMTIPQVKAKLSELANKEFEQGIDMPEVDLKIDFIQLGDTEEYKQYRDLDRLYMADLVQITDLVHGIDVEAEVTEYDYDCLTERYTKLGVGITGANRTAGSIGSFMLPDGSIGGRKLVMGSVDGSRIAYMSIGAAKIGLAAIDSAHIKWAAIKEAHIEDASITRAKIADAAIGTAQIEDASIVGAHVQNGTIEDAHIGTAGIDYAKIRDLAAGTAIIREGIGGKLIIDRLSVSDANIVNLAAGTLIVQGTSGALYQLTVDEQGQVITELRQIGNDDIANVSLNAGEKLIKSSITADLLNVQEIFASEALIGAIKAHNIEAHSIGTDQLVPGLFEDMISNATGQQLVVEFSHGTILDRENTQTVGRVRIFHLGNEITDRMPDNAVHWERITNDHAGDALWNSDPAHQNTKTITINAADVDFKGVLRCKVDEARLYAVPSISDDGDLIFTDYGDGDSLNFNLNADGDLIYEGPTDYQVIDGILYTDMLIGAFFLDTQLSNLKTSYLDISRHGVELYADGYMNLLAGALFDLQAGNGETYMRLTNKDPFTRLIIGGEDKDTAPFWVSPTGEVRATKLRLNNSNITDFTQHYAYDDTDNAAPGYPMTFDVFIPSEYSGIQSMKLTFKLENFRAYSTGASSGGGATSSAGGGGARTSRSGGGATSGQTSQITIGGNSVRSGGGSSTVQAHTHVTDLPTWFVPAHAHSTPAHSHILDIPDHTHTVPSHTHSIVYGIYKGGKATACQVHVDGNYVGNYAELTARDVTEYLTMIDDKIIRDTWHTVKLTPNALTRIRAQVFVIGVVSQATAAIY